ncbi:MAG: hypothetical protein EXS35_05385 [Pedosphaera sp.]|nr:hypothetical protein [Pedosphaera sp.]
MHLLDLQIKFHKLVVGFFGSLSHRAIRHPRRALAIAAVVTLTAAPGVCWLKLRTDGHALVAQAAPEVVNDKLVRERFGIEDNIVVLIRSDHADGIFNPATLQLVRTLTAELSKLPGINQEHLTSLATEPSFRLRPGTLVHETLLEPPLRTKPELELLREDLRRIELYTGTLISSDGKSTCVLIGAPAGGDRTQLYERVVNLVATHKSAPEDLAVTGAPVAESLLGIHILEDLGVPKALLGTSTRSHKEQSDWKTPGNFYELRRFIARHIGLVPVAMLVMMAVFFVTFRNLLATLLPLPEVAATLLFVFGLMGWLGVPIYLTIAVMPVLLTAMCVTDEIHVFSRYFALLREKPGVNHIELVKETVDEMVCPVANTTLTTAIGFVSFAFSPLRPVQAFGIFTALGVLFSLFYSLTVVPAMLALIKPERLVKRRTGQPTGESSALAAWFARLAAVIARRRWWAVGLVLIVTALTPLGLRRLVIQDSWIDGFDPGSEFRRATQLVNEQFYGMHLLLVTLDATRTVAGEVPAAEVTRTEIVFPGDLVEDHALLAGSTITLSRGDRNWPTHIEMIERRGQQIVARFPHGQSAEDFLKSPGASGPVHFEAVVRTQLQPALIRTSGELGNFLRARSRFGVGGVLSPFDYITTTRFMARPADADARVLPSGAAEIKLMWDYYGLARGRHRLHQIVDSNYWESVTTVFLKDANFIDTAKLMNDLRGYEREHLAPKGIKLGFAGDVAVSQSLIKGIVTTQMQSLFWSLVGIYAVTAIFGRSLRWGIYCVLPSALAVLINFAVMGWFGIPLGVATSMFAGMTLGIGVDFAIHVVEGYGFARAAGANSAEALGRAMALTGPPVLVNTIAISLGFGVLMLSQVPANARLGLLTVLGLVNCLIASLLILPVLLYARSRGGSSVGR